MSETDTVSVVPLCHISEWMPDHGTYPSPMDGKRKIQFRRPDEYILQDITGRSGRARSRAHTEKYNAVMRAGPRKELSMDPANTNACIISTGGLCPGLNSVIEELVRTLKITYGAQKVYGIRYGFAGFDPSQPPLELTPESVLNIHQKGGTMLGTCRGGFDEAKIIAFLKERAITQVYVMGGDGSHRAALRIHDLCVENRLGTVVVGIPKTIDNDIPFFDKTFGFDTAVEVASGIIDGAFVEASSVKNGVGIIKLMGRDSGFVVRNAALSNNVVNACLIPEVDFEIEGPNGLLTWLTEHLAEHGQAVILISEAAGQKHVPATGKDATGHNVYEDVGKWLKKTIEAHWKATNSSGKVFLMDPSYSIRSVPANTGDNALCIQLAQSAVHTAYAGYSGVTVGQFHGLFAVLPISIVTAGRRQVNVEGSVWQTVAQRLAFSPSLM